MEINGTYGSNQTHCNVLIDGPWYCVEGSCMVNRAPLGFVFADGLDVETVPDVDCFTWSGPIETLEELTAAIEA